MKLLKSWLPLILAVLMTIAFRFPLLDSLPPGLNFDEGGEGVAALDVTNGQFQVMWPIGGGKEPLMAYLVQPLFWIFGPTRLALRLYSAIWGVIAVVATWFLARQLWPDTEDILWHTWVPAFAAFGLATAFWHVAYSRIAFRAISNPAVEALALGFLWRALRTWHWRDFLLAGFAIGGLAYTYLAGRFVPIAIALFFGVQIVIAWGQGKQPLLLTHSRKLVAMVGMALLVFAPMAIFFIQNPGAFGERAAAVSIFSPAMNHGNFWGTLWDTTVTTLGTFVALTGDPNPLGNIPGRPELSPLLGIFFVLGVAVSLVRWRRPPYLFLLIWWPIMLLPAILAPEGAPHHLRLIGTAPGTYIFVAVGMVWVLMWVGSKSRTLLHTQPWLLPTLLALLIFTPTAIQTYRDYFIHWANEVDHYMPFDIYAEELADQIAANVDPRLAYAIPMDIRAAHEARHYSLDFLYHGETPYSYIVDDEATAAQALTKAAAGKERLAVVRWAQDKHQAADEKGLVSFLLATGGAVLTDRVEEPVYAIETFQLPPDAVFAFPAIDTPINVTLDNLIQIRRATVLPELAASQQVAIGATFARIAPTNVDYKVSLRLIAPDGAVVSQVDRTLRHNWHQGTSLWPAEEVNEYYLLPFPADAVDGSYEVRAVVYHPETLAPLTMDGLVEVRLGDMLQ